MAKRFAELDAFRGIAALGVMVFHYTMFVTHMRDYGDFPFHFEVGKYGLNLFFVVSGFVIYFTLDRCKTVGDFAFSRFSRLYPTYWAALGVSLLSCILFDAPIWITGYVINVTMLQRLLGSSDIDMVFWTLVVELVFYVWMALFFAAGWLKRIVTISAVWLVAAATWGAVRRFVELPELVNNYLIVEHIPYFIAGIMFSRIQSDGWRMKYVLVIAGSIATTAIIAGLTGFYVSAVCFSLLALAVAGDLRFLATPILLWLGSISYALYVTHYNFGWRLLETLHDAGIPSAACIPIVIASSLLIASAVTYLIEHPSIRVLREWRLKAVGRAVAPSSPTSGAHA